MTSRASCSLLFLLKLPPRCVPKCPRFLSTSTTPRRISQIPSSRKIRKHRRGRKYRGHTFQSPLEEFFGSYYPRFEYDSTESASHEFYRLCDEFGWDRDDSERQNARREFKNALVKQFNKIYGTDEEDLAGWQNLCHIVDIDPVPDDLETCREVICRTHVNLVDLVDRDVTGQDVQVFKSERKLSEYTRMTRKYFPKENALYPPHGQGMSLNGDFTPARVHFWATVRWSSMFSEAIATQMA